MNNTFQSLVPGPLFDAAVFVLGSIIMVVIVVAIIGLYVMFSPTVGHYRQIRTMEDIEIPESIMRKAVRAGELMAFTPDSDSQELHTMAFGDPTDTPFASWYVRIKGCDFVIGDGYVMVNRPGTTPLVFTNARIE